MTADELRAAVAREAWFQKFELAPGVWTPGVHDCAALLDRLALPEDLSGQAVVDLGTNDGFFAFECERRGADPVYAVDHPTEWGAAGTGRSSRGAFDLARQYLGSAAEAVGWDVEGPRSWCHRYAFDLALLLGVLYHLRDPLGTLRRVRELIRPGGLLIVETLVAQLGRHGPAAEVYGPSRPCGDDPTVYWGPNPAAVRLWLQDAGFAECRTIGYRGDRAVFHAR